jgi:hypothetical protein
MAVTNTFTVHHVAVETGFGAEGDRAVSFKRLVTVGL